MNKNKKIAAIIICLFFVAVLALSFDVIVLQTHHDCCGEDCSICAVLHTADQILEGVKRTVALTAACALFLALAFSLKGICFNSFRVKTPIILFDTLTM